MILLTEINSRTIWLNAVRKTTVLCDNFTNETEKEYLILQYISIIGNRYSDLIVSKRRLNDRPCRDAQNCLTISALKRAGRLYATYDDAYLYFNNSDNTTFKEKLQPLCNELLSIKTEIRKAKNNAIILFNNQISLYAQSENDRRKGAFSGGNYYMECIDLFGYARYEFYIIGVITR